MGQNQKHLKIFKVIFIFSVQTLVAAVKPFLSCLPSASSTSQDQVSLDWISLQLWKIFIYLNEFYTFVDGSVFWYFGNNELNYGGDTQQHDEPF